MNPFDEIAVEEALRQKEAGKATEVVIVSIGPAQASETIRTALAMGADRGVLIKTDALVEPLAVAKLLKSIIAAESPGLVVMGKQTIDDDRNQTGQMLSALTGWSQAPFASNVVVEDGSVEVTREVDGSMQTGSSSCSPSLHRLKVQSLRQTRCGSKSERRRILPARAADLQLRGYLIGESLDKNSISNSPS